MLVDTHAHLDVPAFNADRDEVIARAAEAGVGAVIVPGCDVASSRVAIALAERHPCVFAAVGIHPNSAAEASPDDMRIIADLADHPRVVAIGETGLDHYRDYAPFPTQVRMFERHLSLAADRRLPVIVHFRAIEDEGIAETGYSLMAGLPGVFHCFGGSAEFAERVLALGYYLGFDGPLTFPRSDRREIARMTPLDRCLLETDAPFLSPQRHRGQRNEPAYVVEIAEILAEEQHCTVETVIAATGRNASALFGIPTV